DVEEGYVEWVNLPGGLGLKFGQFFQQFGTLNRWHQHALPFQSRSLPHLALIGEEALAQAGVSIHWLVPLSVGGTYELTFEVNRSSNEALFGESHGPSLLGHLNGFWQLTEAVDLDLGVSALLGDHDTEESSYDQRLFGADSFRGRKLICYHKNWAYLEQRFELMCADYVESKPGIAPTLTGWQSEWVRIRAEYDVIDRPNGTDGLFVAQATVSLGPHKHETY
ncbi:MAG: hypothetical protein P8Y29_12295, partial [Gemmatimonadota bacterium]